jgi:hypothetical protein
MYLEQFESGRKNLSGWYVAILISYFVFQPLHEWIIKLADFLIKMLGLAGVKIVDQNGIWIILILTCFLISVAIKMFFVDSLSINIDKDGGGGAERLWLGFLLIGMYLYIFNRIFTEQPMPTFFPKFAVNLFGGYAESFSMSGESFSSNTWIIIHGLLWHLGPVATFWIGANMQKS